MLRNYLWCRRATVCRVLLNEVLSLNAQESTAKMTDMFYLGILNEVLSLNAQEFKASNTARHSLSSSMKS